MSSLQKVNLGTPPTAVDGDTVRGANTKANANVDVLNAQAALTSAAATITTAQALTSAHVGKRVNINLASAGTINVPSAATMGLDGIVHLRNLGATLVTLAIASGSGDTIALTKLAPGESAVLDSDGSHAIGCLMRGRTNADDETVVGNSVVGGNETVNGTLSVKGVASFGATTPASISAAGAYSGPSAGYTGDVSVAGTISQGSATQKALLRSGFVFSSNTGGIGSTDKYTEMYHDGTTAGVALNHGSGFLNLLSATAAQAASGVPQMFGRNAPVVAAYFSGTSANLGASTVFNCSASLISTGRVRVTLSAAFTYATHMILLSGTAVSNGTNWCVPAVIGNASDGTYIDIGSLATGNGTGSAVDMYLSLLVLKVR